MQVNAVNNNDRSNLKHNAKSSVAIGAISAGVQGLLLPAKTKAAIKNTIIGQDAFVKRIEKAIPNAEETFGQKLDVTKAVEHTKANFPAMKEVAAKASKKMAGTFAAVTAGVFAGELIADKIFNK